MNIKWRSPLELPDSYEEVIIQAGGDFDPTVGFYCDADGHWYFNSGELVNKRVPDDCGVLAWAKMPERYKPDKFLFELRTASSARARTNMVRMSQDDEETKTYLNVRNAIADACSEGKFFCVVEEQLTENIIQEILKRDFKLRHIGESTYEISWD